MKKAEEIKADGSDYLQSLSKLTGLKIKDIQGYITCEFDFPVFKLTKIVFENDTTANIDGEHDIAYIPQSSDDRMPPNMDEDTLQSIYDEDND